MLPENGGSCSGLRLDCSLNIAVLLAMARKPELSWLHTAVPWLKHRLLRYSGCPAGVLKSPQALPVEVQSTSSWLLLHHVAMSLLVVKANWQCIQHRV